MKFLTDELEIDMRLGKMLAKFDLFNNLTESRYCRIT